jgi:hypothetical protein
MGDTRGFAELINLNTMQPRTDLSSTGFALADLGKEYLILQSSEVPDSFSGTSFTATLAAGRYSARWHSVRSRETMPGEVFAVAEETMIGMSAPPEIAGPAVLHLRRI